VPAPISPTTQPDEKRQKWPLFAGLVFLLLLLIVVAVTQLSGGSDSKSADRSGSGSTIATDVSPDGSNGDADSGGSGTAGPIRTVDVSLGSPMNSAAADGLLWMTGVDGELSAVDLSTRKVVASLQVPPAFESMVAAGDGFVAVGNDEVGVVTIIDSASRSVTGSIKLGTDTEDWRPVDLTVAGGHVWVTSVRFDQQTSDPDLVMVIDPVSLEIVARIPTGERPLNPTMIGGRIWVVNMFSDTVSVIDPASMEVIKTIPVGGNPQSIAVSNGGVWVTNTRDASISAIDPINLVVVATIPVGTSLAAAEQGELPGPYTVAGGDGLLWLPMIQDRTVVVVNAATFEVVGTLPIGQDHVIDVGLTPGFAWVSDSQADVVRKIDTSTLEVVDEISVDGSPGDPIIADGFVWIPSTGLDTLTVIDPSAN